MIGGKRIEDELAALLLADNTAQHREVLGDGGQLHLELFRDLADRHRASGQMVEHAPPRLRGQRLENVSHR